jgi:hypothetical protein
MLKELKINKKNTKKICQELAITVLEGSKRIFYARDREEWKP